MTPSYVKFFLPECFIVYFPNEMSLLTTIIANMEFYRIYSNKNTWIYIGDIGDIGERIGFDVKNFYYESAEYMKNKCIHHTHLSLSENIKNNLIKENKRMYNVQHCGNGFNFRLTLNIKEHPLKDKYIYLDTKKHKLIEKIASGNKKCLNLFIQIYKPFNQNSMFTSQYYVDLSIELSVGKSNKHTMKCSMTPGEMQYCCTLYEFETCNDVSSNDLSNACKYINNNNDNDNSIRGIKFKIY
jgi:hypothetical protein